MPSGLALTPQMRLGAGQLVYRRTIALLRAEPEPVPLRQPVQEAPSKCDNALTNSIAVFVETWGGRHPRKILHYQKNKGR